MRAEGYSTWYVCLSVCLSTTIIALQAMRRVQLGSLGVRISACGSPPAWHRVRFALTVAVVGAPQSSTSLCCSLTNIAIDLCCQR